MKKLTLGIMIALVAFLAVPRTAYATDDTAGAVIEEAAETEAIAVTEYRIDELGLTLEIPDDMLVLTRNMEDDDPNLLATGYSNEDVQKIFEDGMIYLNALPTDYHDEICVKLLDEGFEDFEFDETMKDALDSLLTGTYEESGIILGETEMYQHPQTWFYKGDFTNTNTTYETYHTHYMACKNGLEIGVYLFSYTGEALTEEQYAQVKRIVDSIKFAPAPPTD